MRIPSDRAPLILDVRELFEHPGVQRPLAFDAVVGDLRSGLSEVVGPVHFDLKLEYIDGGILVRGEMSGGYSAECRRCVNATTMPFAYQGSELYRPATDVWEEGYVVKENEIDLEPMVRDTVVLGLPESPLCREDCKGLCAACGADLNDGPCDCGGPDRTDLRWAALKDLGRDLNRG
jgi:uncharacterized protein